MIAIKLIRLTINCDTNCTSIKDMQPHNRIEKHLTRHRSCNKTKEKTTNNASTE
jgi:hypothetical protein